jgi:hypothetical protein
MASMTSRLEHYLISIPLPGGYIHGYVMTKDKRLLLSVSDRLMKAAEDHGFTCWPPIILQTHLTTGWKTVRNIITKHQGPEPSEHWKTVKDFHLTGWIMAESNPDTKRLMDLH